LSSLYTPYYSSSSYSSYLRAKAIDNYVDYSNWRRRYYDDYYVPYYSSARYLSDKYELARLREEIRNKDKQKEEKKQYYDDNMFGYDTPIKNIREQ
jgi:hypothetical protein